MAAYSLKDEITKLFGLRTNRKLAAIITDWTHIRNEFELQNTQIDKEGFQLTVKRAGATIAVSKNKKAQFIVVSCAFLMSGEGAEILASGPLDLRKELFYQISMDMVKLGADFNITTYTDDSGANTWQIERVYLRKMVDPASLTEYSFLEQAGSVVRATGSINLLVSIYAARAHLLIDSDNLLVERLTDWLHLRNGYQLLETNNDQKGIRLVAKRGDTTVIIQKNKGSRSVDLTSGVVFTPEHKAVFIPA